MKKRVFAGLLWFYATWYAVSLFNMVTTVPDLLGPTIGLVLGVLIAWDPMNRIWTRFPAREPARQARRPSRLEVEAV